MKIKESELIINPDGSIYHVNLRPEQIADTIITVGDPARVERVAAHFDKVETKVQKREFYTQTGTYKGKRLTVISTGIGTDNIDIVINELDALANIDLTTREVKKDLKSLNFVRIGTSGSIQKDIPVDSFVVSEKGLGFDGLLYYYEAEKVINQTYTAAINKHLKIQAGKATPYMVDGSQDLINLLSQEDKVYKGITGTNVGFYGPQGRVLRAKVSDPDFIDQLVTFNYEDKKVTNLEMETSAIFGLSKLLGHRAVAINAIIANRANGNFSENPKKAVDNLIRYSLNKLAQL
ncbi:nucleoside phosphorylase [Haloflavibacter putidus]|uniref:Uridine phosphorylase n=1 Tax=Haloflavibacter putidus TaxID=2576776 RepID=A0A507ZUF9_9FLAO|nr:nucleoside phosphorylase [Haloflavibacter putidus]TQD40231.1 phosphorylase [Haloflavibacter putidus]